MAIVPAFSKLQAQALYFFLSLFVQMPNSFKQLYNIEKYFSIIY